ncbi:MAG: hypothetical protein ACHQU1_03875 [Gemmatimonadales bacterium]
MFTSIRSRLTRRFQGAASQPRIARLAVAALLCGAAGLVSARPASAQTSVGGVVYGQYAYNVSDSSNNSNNFEITRAYLNVNGRFAGGITTRVTADVYNAGGAGTHAVRFKYATLGYTPEGSALTYNFGLTQTPWIDWEEALWDYRMQGSIAVDRNSYMTSSDFGLRVDGKFNNDMFNFQAGVYNGEGYGNAPGDKRKDFEARASYRLMGTDDGSRVGGLRLSGYGQFGDPTGGGKRQRFIGMLSYRSANITLAGEYMIAKDSATAATTLAGFSCAAGLLCSGHVISVFGVFHFPETRFSVIGRVDMAQTADTSAVGGATNASKTTRIILGASYQLTPNVRLLADYDALSYDSSYTPTAAQVAAKQMALFQMQFTF